MIDLLQKTILGTMMHYPDDIDTAAGIVTAADFSNPMYQDIFSFLVKKQGADLVSISNEFKNKYPISEIVLWDELSHFPSFLAKNCRELKELNRKDALYRLMVDVRKEMDGKTSAEMIETITSRLSGFQTESVDSHETMRSLVTKTMKTLELRYENKGKVVGIPYGWSNLDNLTNGMARGDLIIIAGRPSMGKSAMAANICESVCENGYHALLFSLEMPKQQLMERFFASIGNLNFGRIRSGNFTEYDWPKMHRAAGVIHNYNMTIDDSAAVTLHDMRRKARALKRKTGLDLMLVDYLQLVGMAERESRVLEIGKVSRGLKQLAKELDIAVVLLSQLNRGVDSRPDKRPIMSDLRDSGEIEQDADVILFPFRPAAYCDKCRDKKNDGEHDTEMHQSVAEIIVEKQRNGERNAKVPMVWIGKHQKFVQVD